jgi:glycerol-3-phosphate cytidylyltransferase
MRLGYIAGVWDLLHYGHMKIIMKASMNCDKLIVGCITDEYCASYKAHKPTLTWEERAKALSGVKGVHGIFPHDDKAIKKWYTLIDVLFIGEDYPMTESHKKGLDLAHKHGVKIVMLPYTVGISSTEIKERIKNED